MISFLDEALSGVRIIKAFNGTNFVKKDLMMRMIVMRVSCVQWQGANKWVHLYLNC